MGWCSKMTEQVITTLADLLGHIIQYIIEFFANLLSGWFLMMAMLTVGFIAIIYFRFFKNITFEKRYWR